MSKVFVDVGGYEGFSTLAALDPIFSFDRVFCFEPAARCIEIISRIRDPRLVIVKAGMSNRTGAAVLYHAGTPAGSVFSDAPTWGGSSSSEAIDLMSAGDFFRVFLRSGDRVFMKLNCEGSELDVLDSVVESCQTEQLENVLIDLDALKIPSQRERATSVMQKVDEAGIRYYTPEQVQYGMVTNYGGIRNWLIKAGAVENGVLNRARSLSYNAKIIIYEPSCSGYHKKLVLDALPWLGMFARSRHVGR